MSAAVSPGKIKIRVLHWLNKRPDTRDSDRLLISLIHWQDVERLKKAGENCITWLDFLKLYSEGKLTDSESVIWARKNIQEENEELRGKSYNGRQEHQAEVVEQLFKSDKYKWFIQEINKERKKHLPRSSGFKGLDDKAIRQFKALIKKGVTQSDLEQAITNLFNDPYHMGEGWKHCTPEFLTRSDKFEKFLAQAETPSLAGLPQEPDNYWLSQQHDQQVVMKATQQWVKNGWQAVRKGSVVNWIKQ